MRWQAFFFSFLFFLFLAIFIDQLIRSIYQIAIRNCNLIEKKVEGLRKTIIIRVHPLKKIIACCISVVNAICRQQAQWIYGVFFLSFKQLSSTGVICEISPSQVGFIIKWKGRNCPSPGQS